MHVLSDSNSVRLLSRNVPAGQLAHGLAVADTSSAAASNVFPAGQTLHNLRPVASANVRFGHCLHWVLREKRRRSVCL